VEDDTGLYANFVTWRNPFSITFFFDISKPISSIYENERLSIGSQKSHDP
jgi:hypothetical protein